MAVVGCCGTGLRLAANPRINPTYLLLSVFVSEFLSYLYRDFFIFAGGPERSTICRSSLLVAIDLVICWPTLLSAIMVPLKPQNGEARWCPGKK